MGARTWSPGPSFWNVIQQPRITLTFNVNGKQLTSTFDRNNIMHAHADLGGFSKDQIALMRESAKIWLRGLPINDRGPNEPVQEFESAKAMLPGGQPRKTLRINGTLQSHSCMMFKLGLGETAEFDFKVGTPGTYQVSVCGMRGSDHGAFWTEVDGQTGETVSLFFPGSRKAPSKAETGWLLIGTFRLGGPTTKLKFIGTDPSPFSTGTLIGLDAVRLDPMPEGSGTASANRG